MGVGPFTGGGIVVPATRRQLEQARRPRVQKSTVGAFTHGRHHQHDQLQREKVKITARDIEAERPIVHQLRVAVHADDQAKSQAHSHQRDDDQIAYVYV